MRLVIQNVHSNLVQFDVQVNESDSVAELKRCIEHLQNQPYAQQVLLFRGLLLRDEQSISHLGVKEGDSVVLIIRKEDSTRRVASNRLDFGALNFLSYDCVWEVCSYLGPRELCRLSRVNRSLFELCGHPTFWKRLFRKNFPFIDFPRFESANPAAVWRSIFRDSVYYFGNAMCYISCSEGTGKPQVISPYKDHNALERTVPDDWSVCWERTEAHWGDKPHHGQSLRLDSANTRAMLMRFVPTAPAFGNRITVFLQVRMKETSYNRGQQDIISLWYCNERMTLEYHPDSGLGLYTNGGRMWHIRGTEKHFTKNVWHSVLLVFDRGVVWLYIDGYLVLNAGRVARDTWSLFSESAQMFGETSEGFFLGCDGETNWSDCNIANVLISNRVLDHPRCLDFFRRL